MASLVDTAAKDTQKILVIDDEQRIRDACSVVLSDQGFTAGTAKDGEKSSTAGERHRVRYEQPGSGEDIYQVL